MRLTEHARRQVHQQANQIICDSLPALAPGHRRVLVALLARTAEGWHFFVHRSPTAGNRTATAFLVGPSGVYAILICDSPPTEETAQAVILHTEERCAAIRGPGGQVLARSGIHLLVITPEGSRPAVDHRLYRSVRESGLDKLLRNETRHLHRNQIAAIATQAATLLAEYHELRVLPPPRTGATTGLLEVDDLTADQLAAAQQGEFESWLTFLHPAQEEVVRRRFNGPARISGPAGTGKTVVALHRLRHLARRTTGRLLFTTFVRTLPLVNQQSFHRLAPELADRVDFINLHSWVRGFLDARGIHLQVQPGQAVSLFSRAWVRHRDSLQHLEPNSAYWQTEIDRVIKGRGIQTPDEYARAPRRGRGVGLDPRQRALSWQLYRTYQDYLDEKGLHDYNDMISIALAALRDQPLEENYAAVVVDEVQDITLNGLRLLKELAGEGPDQLLLVGDGQQQVYPGGWRLADAGIHIQGRGEILRINYRNRSAVLDFARRIDATNHVEDLNGESGVRLRQAEAANDGGEVRTWRGTKKDVPNALITVIRELSVPLGQTALIVFSKTDHDWCTSQLRAADIAFHPLESYEGVPDGKLKVGTVHRAKGQDFQAVLVVRFVRSGEGTSESQAELVDLQNRQYLVAATRARDFLWWATVDPE